MRFSYLRSTIFLACVSIAACGGSDNTDTGSGDDGGGGDTSSGGDSSATDGNGTDSKGSDTNGGGDGAGDTTPSDGSGDTPSTDAPSETSGCAGVECAGFPSSFVSGCTVDDNCIGEIHQVDCCGAKRAMGMNHSEASKFCPAEFGTTGGSGGCRGTYPTPAGCSSDVITADEGGTATDTANVAVHCVVGPAGGSGTCKTFVCGTAGGPACPTARRIGTCG